MNNAKPVRDRQSPWLRSYSGTVSERDKDDKDRQDRLRSNILYPGGFREMDCVVYIQGHSVFSVHTVKASSIVSQSRISW
jgi:hypothetical protein